MHKLSGSFKIIIVITWFWFVLVLISAPMESVPSGGITYEDKIFHFFLFGIMAALLTFSLAHYIQDKNLALALSFLGASAYSFMCEIAQIFVPGRTASADDLLAGIAGVIVFLYLAKKQKNILIFINDIACKFRKKYNYYIKK
jgi:VanZ family protein